MQSIESIGFYVQVHVYGPTLSIPEVSNNHKVFSCCALQHYMARTEIHAHPAQELNAVAARHGVAWRFPSKSLYQDAECSRPLTFPPVDFPTNQDCEPSAFVTIDVLGYHLQHHQLMLLTTAGLPLLGVRKVVTECPRQCQRLGGKSEIKKRVNTIRCQPWSSRLSWLQLCRQLHEFNTEHQRGRVRDVHVMEWYNHMTRLFLSKPHTLRLMIDAQLIHL